MVHHSNIEESQEFSDLKIQVVQNQYEFDYIHIK